MIRLWLCSSSGGGTEDTNREYDLLLDLTDGTSIFEYTEGGNKKRTNESVGLIGFSTNETMQAHGASAVILVAQPFGGFLRDSVMGQDMLRIDAIGPDGSWEPLFDGFVSSINYAQEGSPSSSSFRFTIQAEGGHRLVDQGWENWQGVLRAGSSKIGGAQGGELVKSLKASFGNKAPQEMVKGLLTHGVNDLMNFQARGETLKAEGYWSYGEGSNWTTDFGFTLVNSIDWILMQQGKLSSMIHSLVEPEIHEFFLTYQDGKPCWILRPHPFPGPEGDDGRWTALPLVELGTGSVPGAIGINGSRDDSRRANVFHWAGSSGTPYNGNQFYGKLLIGCWAHERHIAKYGYCARQVTTHLPGMSQDGKWFTDVAPKIIERIAWQDTPLSWLEQQSRHYTWLPLRVAGLHVGKRVTDYSEGVPTSGYLVSVQHEFQATADGIQAFSVLGLDRVCRGASASEYADSVRAFAKGLNKVEYATSSESSEVAGSTAPVTPSVAQSGSGRVVKPVQGDVKSPYGKRKAPCAGASTLHYGIDLGAALGAPVKAPVTGVVIEATSSKLNGNFVRIRADQSGEVHTLCHLKSFSVAGGKHVTAGDVIAECGSTGVSTGPHVHWGVRDANGKPIDPNTAKG